MISFIIIILACLCSSMVNNGKPRIASLVKGFAFISLFGGSSLRSKTCLAFQTTPIGARVGRNRLAPTVCQSIPKNDDEEFTSPDTTNTAPPTPSNNDADTTAKDIVTNCMDALLKNDSPWENSGLEVCFDFSSDRCRASMGGDLDKFISHASNPTFGSMANADEYTVLSVGPVIAASMTRGAMQTVLIKVKPAKGDDRTFLWTMQQERRPPRQGLWLVHECISVENEIGLTSDH